MISHREFDNMLLQADAWVARILDALEADWMGERDELWGSQGMLADLLDIDEGGMNAQVQATPNVPGEVGR